LSNVLHHPHSIGITGFTYDRLFDDRKYSNGAHMWSDQQFAEFGGVSRGYRTTTYRWSMN
jgi:hypothetical protein